MAMTGASARPKRSEERARRESLEGVAFSCIAAVAFGFVILRPDVTLQAQLWLWLLFVVGSGLCLAPWPDRPGRYLLHALSCSVIFFAVLIFQGALDVIWRSLYLRILSWPPVPSNDMIRFVHAGLWYLFLLAATVPAITIATLARNKVVLLGKRLLSLDPRKFGRLEKAINTIIRILVVVGFGFLVGR
jgi:hypothetical protein